MQVTLSLLIVAVMVGAVYAAPPDTLGVRDDERASAEPLASADRWIMIATFSVVTLPFAFGVAFMTHRTLWFKFRAARAKGTVVEKSEGQAPSLTVRYRTEDGQVLRTSSDGSATYTRVPTGATITVLYDPARPERARLDLFLENWLRPLLLGVLGAIVSGAMLFILAMAAAPWAPDVSP